MVKENNPFNKTMQLAILEAKLAFKRNEIPVGAVVIREGVTVSKAGNETAANLNPTFHAEILALQRAVDVLGTLLFECDLYVTLEPCPMCAHAISLYRVRRLYIAAEDKKGGGVINGPKIYSQPSCHHAPEVYDGICSMEASFLLKSFFKKLRNNN
tara:strand:- start:1588 stop:2055 length:468 start_codon:yes stop_codon:yes gene_type:complete